MVFLSEYRPPDHVIDEVELRFELDAVRTVVHAGYAVRRTNLAAPELVLPGEGIELLRIAVDGVELADGAYAVEVDKLRVTTDADTFRLELTGAIGPEANTSLEGLYHTNGRFCTQCEAEGFRKIIYFPDRPDVLSRYLVRMEADKEKYPTLLSNGNRLEWGEMEGGRHYAVWRDSIPKPSYLFALVAGAFDQVEDGFVTRSGRRVAITIHTDPGEAHLARFAMDSIQRSMAWDEKVFGLEYDLNEFHMVSMRDFNFGAMENKGLNIFNSARILADCDIATDSDFFSVERVVAHEYFHNWTGNRITLRDWFQLCLKEGLTIFRDQEFTASQRSAYLARIRDVEFLWEHQFPEDAGGLAHAVRPDSYGEISNLYTPTVYRKGAELIRMVRSIIGADAFGRGLALYFERCDGKAVTLEDLLQCFEEAAGRSLERFAVWYRQPGTPVVEYRCEHDAAKQEATLTVRQKRPENLKAEEWVPVPIPLHGGLLSEDGGQMEASMGGGERCKEFEVVLDREEGTYVFEGVRSAPVVSLLRHFTAPVVLQGGGGAKDWLVQMHHDPDPFTRWWACQHFMEEGIGKLLKGEECPEMERFLGIMRELVGGGKEDPGFVALLLEVPGPGRLLQVVGGQARKVPDIEALYAARGVFCRRLAEGVAAELQAYLAAASQQYLSVDPANEGYRALANACMRVLAALGEGAGNQILSIHERAGTLTTRMGAIEALGSIENGLFDRALEAFLERWGQHELLADKWFEMQCAAPRNDALDRVRRLSRHERFSYRVPNRARMVFEVFGRVNLRAFHRVDGSGYELMGAAIRSADELNPSVAARLAKLFDSCRYLDGNMQRRAESVMQSLLDERASTHVKDILERMLRKD